MLMMRVVERTNGEGTRKERAGEGGTLEGGSGNRELLISAPHSLSAAVFSGVPPKCPSSSLPI